MNPSINWDIEFRPIQDAKTGLIIPNWKRITKNVPKDIVKPNGETVQDYRTFHIAKKTYNPPTTEEFQEHYHELAKITGFEPVGFQEWDEGSRIFGYLKNTQDKFDIDGHEIDDYLLIGVGYGGNTSFFIGSVNKLLRCQNEFGLINRTWKIRNTSGRQLKTKELLDGFQEHMTVRNTMFETFRQFKKVNIHHDLIVEAKRRIMDMDKEETVADLGTRRKKQYSEITAAISIETSELGNNLWGLFNGVTRFTTHKMMRDQSEKNIFGNVVQGEVRHKYNRSAYEFCKEYMENEHGILLATN
jgi:hypothetical protein